MYNKSLIRRNIITLLAFGCLTTHAFAEDIALQNNAPDNYVVVKGDTLWGISGKFLKNPWQWPKIWNLNRSQIKNPHWIYPGDVVVLDRSGATPQLRLLHETVTLQPGVIVEPIEKDAIKSISPSIITPFLSQPLLVENDQLDIESAPRIVSGQDNRLVLSPGTRVYVNGIKEGDNTHWNVYRPGEAILDPDTKELLGTEAVYLGDLTVTRYGDPATAEIVRAKEEIFTKDRLIVSQDEFKNSFVPHAPENQLQGRIIQIYGGIAEGGPNTVVSINLGKRDGLEEGHVLAISRTGAIVNDPEYKRPSNGNKVIEEKPKLKEVNVDVSRDKDGKAVVNFEKDSPTKEQPLEPGQLRLPNERVGLLMVFRTFNRVSYGLIMNATDSIYTLDTVQTP